MSDTDYTTVTELPGCRAPAEQHARLYQRYRFASEFCKNKDVIEVACGGGAGLGYLARTAKSVTGSDIDEGCLEFAREQYAGKDNIDLLSFDAHTLPFDDKSFDVVIMYEAIYYLDHPEKFLAEAKRVLRDTGVLLLCSANKSWSDFNPSPFSKRFYNVPELHDLLEPYFKQVKMYGGFSTRPDSLVSWAVSILKRTAVRFHLMPKTMKRKELLKRLFFGALEPLPLEIHDGMAEYAPLVPIDARTPNGDFKVIFVVGKV